MDRRIEVVSPVYDEDIKKELSMIVEKGLADTSQGHWVNMNGNLPRRKGASKIFERSQEELYRFYLEDNPLR